ncbi:MAG: NADH-quinone oxidoreductase subunit H [Chloroflexota bacterium]
MLAAQAALVLVAAPLLNGVIKASKSRSRAGAGGLLSPASDILKLLGRESVVSEHASWIFHVVPYVYFGAYLRWLLVPTLLIRPPLEELGDAVVLVGAVRVARASAGAGGAGHVASNFGGMGASREETAFARRWSAGLLLGLFALALPVGSTALGAMAAAPIPRRRCCWRSAACSWSPSPRPAASRSTARPRGDDGRGDVLEYSGRPLGLLLWGLPGEAGRHPVAAGGALPAVGHRIRGNAWP